MSSEQNKNLSGKYKIDPKQYEAVSNRGLEFLSSNSGRPSVEEICNSSNATQERLSRFTPIGSKSSHTGNQKAGSSSMKEPPVETEYQEMTRRKMDQWSKEDPTSIATQSTNKGSDASNGSCNDQDSDSRK